jgi:hypothetical protein
VETGELQRAAKFGRFLLATTGGILLVVAAAYAYFAPGEQLPVVVAAIGVGLVQIWLAIAGSNRTCAVFGFFAPWWPT